MMVIKVQAYQAYDGKLFLDEKHAEDHELKLEIQTELDRFFNKHGASEMEGFSARIDSRTAGEHLKELQRIVNLGKS